MDHVLVDLLEEIRPLSPRPPDEVTIRLRVLIGGRMGLEKAAARVGLDVDDARQRLAAVGMDLPAEPSIDMLRQWRQVEGLTVGQIAERCGLTEGQMAGRLKRAGIRLTSKRALRAGLNAVRADAALLFRAEIVRLHAEGLTQRQVGDILGVNQRTVWNELAAAGVPRRPRGVPAWTIPAEVLVDLYATQKLTARAVAAQLGVCEDVVNNNLDRHRIPRHRHRQPVPRKQLENLYVRQALSLQDIATRLGLTRSQVRADLRHHGIPCRPPGGRPGTRRGPER